jgi:hypothetical protein
MLRGTPILFATYGGRMSVELVRLLIGIYPQFKYAQINCLVVGYLEREFYPELITEEQQVFTPCASRN